MLVLRLASRSDVPASLKGEKMIAPGPASTNGLNLLEVQVEDICSAKLLLQGVDAAIFLPEHLVVLRILCDTRS